MGAKGDHMGTQASRGKFQSGVRARPIICALDSGKDFNWLKDVHKIIQKGNNQCRQIDLVVGDLCISKHAQVDQCMFGLRHPETDDAMQKKTIECRPPHGKCSMPWTNAYVIEVMFTRK